MRGISNKTYALGVLLTLLGGSGLAEISTSNHGCFALCVTMFSIGFSLCIAGYVNDRH